MTDDDRFRDEILSMTTAQPGWTIRAQVNAHKRGTSERWVEDEAVFPVVGWATVSCHFRGGGVANRAEAVFLNAAGQLEHESEYRWKYSELEPTPGQPRVTVSFEIRAPSPA
ncbi:hypothetical protein [Streptomyces anulatus]|uniref:hypothetical protein n=1 Tax=Streptomyces anulatus TaxID=1892 RepID=UPI0038655B15|nr:hypothetical protein OG575_05525 [Streptomyces anulatus]